MNRKIILWCLVVSFGLLSCAGAQAQAPAGTAWHLEKEGNGIQVYTATAGASGLKYIKVNAQLAGSLEKVVAVFRDIARQKEWVYGTRQAYLIKKIDDNNLLYYNETKLPWPVSNRDVAIQMRLEEDASHHNLAITQVGEPTAVPVDKGIVRVPHLEGLWQFREESHGLLHAEYFLDLNPGGSLPAWVVNMFVTKGPYETFIKLRNLLNR